MTSTRPYLIRALYDWIIDNDFTPHLLVDAEQDGVAVPVEHVHEGRIVLNINPSAVQGLELGNDWIQFNARFGGQARNVRLPITAVMAIYARENGQGMAFGSEPGDGGETPPPGPPEPKGSSKKPNLKIVK